jgi:AraC-like DNA-binding protein
VEAPNKAAIKEMHEQAHGAVPHKIIEVDGAVVESFLGRIEDPKKSQKTELNIINDPAFRTIMIAEIKPLSLKDAIGKKVNLVINNQNKSLFKTINKFKGSIVRQKVDSSLISFDSVTNAVLCALEIQEKFKKKLNNTPNPSIKLQIGLCAGVPVSGKKGIFEDTIQMAERLCDVVKGQVVVTSEVRDLYESENLNISIDEGHMNVLNSNDEKFLNLLMDYTEREWSNTTLNVDDFSKCLGYSKSQLYRKMMAITGKSPNNFIREYRLSKALKLLNKRTESISEIAFATGFNSPAYFTKEFRRRFDLLPTDFIKASRTNSITRVE